jgi:hypothetical protein
LRLRTAYVGDVRFSAIPQLIADTVIIYRRKPMVKHFSAQPDALNCA